jgi:hypothetical protein
VVGLAGVALEIHAKTFHLRERGVIDVVDHVERLDHGCVAVAEHGERDRVGGFVFASASGLSTLTVTGVTPRFWQRRAVGGPGGFVPGPP